ncbi:MAG: ATP-binding protein [Spirochaetaceae bacterium]|jgi:predicted AAA+ superfamily ATPase|nr:ATP-binding protein [Spirochaetaceae bacterium]
MADEDLPFSLLACLEGLTVFSRLKKTRLLKRFRELLRLLHRVSSELFSTDVLHLLEEWAGFVRAFHSDSSSSEWYVKVASLTLGDDNPFTRAAAAKELKVLEDGLCGAARMDLHRLGLLAALDLEVLAGRIADLLAAAGLEDAGNAARNEGLYLAAAGKKRSPVEKAILKVFPREKDWGAALSFFAGYLRKNGAGLPGRYASLYWDGRLLPVRRPDPVRLDDLYEYGGQRSVVLANTESFVRGRPANNLLLYGDRGTGKSATIKAVCGEYADKGLRLVELRKKDILKISEVMETLASRTPRFVLFIDDLSFEEADSSFTSLKALLEGGAEGRPKNVIIYATSNRRHLVKERLADRQNPGAEEVRSFDAIQEQFSLSDRFGVTLVFMSPNQEEYLAIACFLGEKRGLIEPATTDPDAARARFCDNALRWEKWFNGRSPRTAVQYVDWVEGGAAFPWE